MSAKPTLMRGSSKPAFGRALVPIFLLPLVAIAITALYISIFLPLIYYFLRPIFGLNPTDAVYIIAALMRLFNIIFSGLMTRKSKHDTLTFSLLAAAWGTWGLSWMMIALLIRRSSPIESRLEITRSQNKVAWRASIFGYIALIAILLSPIDIHAFFAFISLFVASP